MALVAPTMVMATRGGTERDGEFSTWFSTLSQTPDGADLGGVKPLLFSKRIVPRGLNVRMWGETTILARRLDPRVRHLMVRCANGDTTGEEQSQWWS